MSRHHDPVIGKLIAANLREAEITRLRIDSDGEWWAGMALLSWGCVFHPGPWRLVTNDRHTADLFVDGLRGDGTGGELAVFRGYGPVPGWITRSTVCPGGVGGLD